MLPGYIAYLVIPINIVAYFFYFKGILGGKVKPNLVSWSIWTIAPLLAFFFQIKAGAGLSSLPVFMAGFCPLLVIILAIVKRNSYWKLTALDIYCGALALIALLLYITTQNLSISILFAILSDGLAAVPTIVKTWKFPDTESPGPYIAGLSGNVLGLLIIDNWIFTIYSFGLYNILINVCLILPIYRERLSSLAIFGPKN